MKKIHFYIIVIIFSLITIQSFSQTVSTMSKYELDQQNTFRKGDTVTLGNAAGDSTFNYIITSPFSKKVTHLSNSFNNQKIIVFRMEHYQWNDYTNYYYAEFKDNGTVYYIDIDGAARHNEIITSKGKEEEQSLVHVSKTRIVFRSIYPDLEVSHVESDNETFYTFSFRDMRYQSLMISCFFSLSEDETIKLAKGLLELQDKKYKPGDASVQVNKEVLIFKSKGQVGNDYTIGKIGIGSGSLYLGGNKAKKLSEAILNYVNK